MFINRLLLLSIPAALVTAMFALMLLDVLLGSTPSNIKDVLEGRADLQCHMLDGFRIIDPELIKYFHEGTWVFREGGYANQCRILTKE